MNRGTLKKSTGGIVDKNKFSLEYLSESTGTGKLILPDGAKPWTKGKIKAVTDLLLREDSAPTRTTMEKIERCMMTLDERRGKTELTTVQLQARRIESFQRAIFTMVAISALVTEGQIPSLLLKRALNRMGDEIEQERGNKSDAVNVSRSYMGDVVKHASQYGILQRSLRSTKAQILFELGGLGREIFNALCEENVIVPPVTRAK